MRHTLLLGWTALLAAATMAQAQAPRSLVGTVTGFKAEQAAIEIRLDGGSIEPVQMGAETLVQRIAPGEKDLRKATGMRATDISIGDRVLVTWAGGVAEARRVIVMGAAEINSKREAERLDWQKRGLAGVVEAVKGNEITLKSRSFAGERTVVIEAGGETIFRRYRPDSVKFTDAAIAKIADIKKGDQLRGRGTKSADGTRVEAEEVVFGTFVTKAGTVTAVNAGAGEVVVKDLDTGKPLTIRVTSDSQIRQMPAMGAGMAGGSGSGRPVGAGGMGPGGPGGMGPGGPGGAPDLAQTLERMPTGRLEDLKPGGTIVVSSTRGVAKDQITAIMLLGNAERLIQMATAANASRQVGMGSGMMGGGMMGGGAMGGLELPGMLP